MPECGQPNVAFFDHVRSRGGLLGVAVDPLTAHECGNSRYLAIPWLDKCLELRLPEKVGDPLKEISTSNAWLAEPAGTVAVSAAEFEGDPLKMGWLPDQSIAKSWMQFRKDTNVTDTTPPPSPSRVIAQGGRLTWTADADLESGIEKFVVMRNGEFLAEVTGGKNRFGRPLFSKPSVQRYASPTSGKNGVHRCKFGNRDTARILCHHGKHCGSEVRADESDCRSVKQLTGAGSTGSLVSSDLRFFGDRKFDNQWVA